MTDTAGVKIRIVRALWGVELESLPWWKASLIRMLRVVYVAIRDLVDGQISLQAMSLVYTTLLSLVPLLAVSFSVLKGFGVHNQIEPLLLNFLKPMGERGVEITSRIMGFVDGVKASVLGSVGLGLLVYTVISLIQKIERAFNYTWHVKRTRPLLQRFSDYLSVIAIGPLLIFSALGLTATILSTTVVQKIVAVEVFGSLLKVGTLLVPYLLVIGAFTFVYIFVPNTKVRLRSALTGGAVAGILWELTGWGFTSFVVHSTRYTAIYSGFAILILFMIWLYLSWLILLVGASFAFYHQHPESVTAFRRVLRLSNRLKEKLCMLVIFLIGQNYYNEQPAWTIEGLAQRLRVPLEALEPVLAALEENGLLTQTGDETPRYVPARPLEITQLKDVLDAVRVAPEETEFDLQGHTPELAVEQLVDYLDQAMTEALRGHTVKDLALSEPLPAVPVSPVTEQKVTLTGSRDDA